MTKSICERRVKWGEQSADDAETPSRSIYPAIRCNVNKCKHALKHRKTVRAWQEEGVVSDQTNADRNAVCHADDVANDIRYDIVIVRRLR